MPSTQRHVALLGDRRLERLAEQGRDLDAAHAARRPRVLTMPPSRSWSSASSMSASSREPPSRSRPSPPAAGRGSGRSRRRRRRCFIRRATTEGVRKLSLRNEASVSPIRSLLRGMIAVCGIGRPSGWRNRAVTANQSAMPPTSARLGEGADEAPGRMEMVEPGRGDEDRRHAGEHRRRQRPHAARALGRGEAAEAGAAEQAHAGSITGTRLGSYPPRLLRRLRARAGARSCRRW